MGKGNRRKSAAGKAKPAAGPSTSGKTIPRHSLLIVKRCCVDPDAGAATTRKRKHSSEEHEARTTPPAPTASTAARGTKRKAQDEPPASPPAPRRSRRKSGRASVEPERQPAARQHRPSVRNSRGDTSYPRSGYEADEEDSSKGEASQGSPGIQNPAMLNRPGGGDGGGRRPPGGGPTGGDDGGSSRQDASDEDSAEENFSSSDSPSAGSPQPGSPTQNDASSGSDSSISEESDWGSDIESLDERRNVSEPGFILAVRYDHMPLDPAEAWQLQRVCLRMTSGDLLSQAWEIANYLTVRGNVHRLTRGMFNVVQTSERVESREHLPAKRVLEDIARAIPSRKFRCPSNIMQGTDLNVVWAFEIDLLRNMLTVYGPRRAGEVRPPRSIFGSAFGQDWDRIPRQVHEYTFSYLGGFNSAEAFQLDFLSRFNLEAAEHYGIPRTPQGLQNLHNPAQLDEAHSESNSPSVTTPSTDYTDYEDGRPTPKPIPFYRTRIPPWESQQSCGPGPHNQLTEAPPPAPENPAGTLPGHYDSGYTGGQGGTHLDNHTYEAPPQVPEKPNLPFPGGYCGGAVGGLPPERRIRYTDDSDSDDEIERRRPSGPGLGLVQYFPRNPEPARWSGSWLVHRDTNVPEGPHPPRTPPGPNYYATYAPTSPNQDYSPRPRREDRDSRDGSTASTERLDENDGDEGPARRSPVVYHGCGQPTKIYTQQPTAEDEGHREERTSSPDPDQENDENAQAQNGPNTPARVGHRLLQYRDSRVLDSDSSDSSVNLSREPYGDDDGSPTMRVRAAIRRMGGRTVDNAPEELHPLRRAPGMLRRRPHTMSPGTIRETIENDFEDRPVQRRRHTLSPGALRHRIVEDDLPDLGSPRMPKQGAAAEGDLPDYESDLYELPQLVRGRAPSPGATRYSLPDASPDASPRPPDSSRAPHTLNPREAGYAADDSDSDPDSDASPGPPDSTRAPRSSTGGPPASPSKRPLLKREAQDADTAQTHAAELEPTPAPARENEKIVFQELEWNSPAREPIGEDVGPRTLSPLVGWGYIHEDAYPHPPPSRSRSEDGREELEDGYEDKGQEENQDVESSVAVSNYEALVAEEQRLAQEYSALLEEQSPHPAVARRMLVSAEYYSSPEPEEHAGLKVGDGGYISVGSTPPSEWDATRDLEDCENGDD